MKSLRRLIVATFALFSGLASSQNLDNLPPIAGAGVDKVLDKIFIRDASVAASAGALRAMTIGDLVNVPGMFGSSVSLNHGTAPGNLVRLDPTTGKLPAVDGSLLTNLPAQSPSIGSVSGLGTNVATALAKPTSTAGSIQLVGDPLSPTAIILPDMTGLTPPVGAIGLKNGQLAVGDALTVGGKTVLPRRYSGVRNINFNGQSKSSAFVKVFGIPLTAQEMAGGRVCNVIGKFSLKNINGAVEAGTLSAAAGWAFLNGSTLNNPGSASSGRWRAVITTIPGGVLTAMTYESALELNLTNYAGLYVSIAPQYNQDVVTVPGYLPFSTANTFESPQSVTLAAPDELCWMLSLKNSVAGSYPNSGAIVVSWDFTIEFKN